VAAPEKGVEKANRMGPFKAGLDLRFKLRVLEAIWFGANQLNRDRNIQFVIETTENRRKVATASMRQHLISVGNLVVRERGILHFAIIPI
jgi:hypothetical protein